MSIRNFSSSFRLLFFFVYNSRREQRARQTTLDVRSGVGSIAHIQGLMVMIKKSVPRKFGLVLEQSPRETTTQRSDKNAHCVFFFPLVALS